MKQTQRLTLVVVSLVALLSVPSAAFGQGSENPPNRGHIDVGIRHIWGDVYGRPDLPFSPDLLMSKLNEYNDLRNNVFVRSFHLSADDVFGTRNYLRLQSESSLYRDQSYLVSLGQYGRFKLQFRYDQIPHTYTNTARTLLSETAPGVYTISPAIRNSLRVASSTGTAAQITNSLPSFIATQIVPGLVPFVPSITRKTGTGLASIDVTPDWTLSFLFSREKQEGTRPIGVLMNSSPSVNASGSPGTVPNVQSPGTAVEAPEPIDYFNNNVKAGTEYGNRRWGIQLGYHGSIFQSEIKSLIVDNPFATADVPVQLLPPGNGCTPAATAANCAVAAIPSRAQQGTYPSNQAHYLNAAGAVDLNRYLRIVGTVNPGWLRQDDAFLPYTINSAITGLLPLPAPSLGGSKQTLSMNWSAITDVKSVQFAAKYRHYDYNNNTAGRVFNPVQGDIIGANSTATGQGAPGVWETRPFAYNKKTLELSGNWFFTQRSSAKFGYEAEWFDRHHRDADRSLEHSVFSAVDLSLTRDLLLRLSYRHSDRQPEHYEDEEALVNNGGIPAVHPNARRFDEAARLLDRADAMLQYNIRQFTLSGSFQTIQNNFNRRLDVNSPVPLNFLTDARATSSPYYLYGALKDISHIYAFDVDWAVSNGVSLFAEYAHERYGKRMVSRSRTPGGATNTSLDCGTGQACDTPNNDWMSTYHDIFDTYAAGVDTYARKASVTAYYSLSAGKGNVISRALGDPTIASGRHRFTLTGTSAAFDYPQTTTRIHDVTVVFKYRLTANLTPKLEYRMQQYDNKDYKTSVTSPYMGCIGAGTVVVSAPCINVGANVAVTYPSPYYPGFVVGDTGAARYLFLGADQPSYRAHIFSASLQYNF